MKIGIYYYATKVYKDYFDGFYKSLDNFFPGHEKKVILFTDDIENKYKDMPNVGWHYINHYPWPIITLYKFYRTLENLNDEFDAVFHFNSNVVFKENVNYDDLSNLINNHKIITITHYYDNPYFNPFDKNLRYIQGGVWGGAFQDIKQMLIEHTKLLNYWINEKHVIPQWHDETIFNEWYAKNPNRCVPIDCHKYLTILYKHDKRIRK